jgi:broad specificity phosphatase PhoE
MERHNMILHVTRHGQTSKDKSHQPEDPYLSELGRKQAQRLKDLNFQGPIYSSPYLRTIETADVIAEVLDTVIIPTAAMREYFIRENQLAGFQGATVADLQTTYSRVQTPPDFPYPWWTTQIESNDMIEARVAPLINTLTDGASDALLVGHGASVTGVHRYVLRNHAPEHANHGKRGWNCVLSSFQFTPQFKIIHLLDTDHLPDDVITNNAKSRAQVLQESPEQNDI